MGTHKRKIKGFSQLSRTPYGKDILVKSKMEERIMLGFYSSDSSTTGELAVQWIRINGKIEPKIITYGDPWRVLAKFHSLFNLVSKHDNITPITPDEFCDVLRECGFIDRTLALVK